MDEECYTNGSCKLCGCQTTALQCAGKACDKPCYPKMLSRKVWKDFCAGQTIVDDKGEWNLINTGTRGDRLSAVVFRPHHTPSVPKVLYRVMNR